MTQSDGDQTLRVRQTVVLLLLYLTAMSQVHHWVEVLTGSFAAGIVVLIIAVLLAPITFRLFVRPRGSALSHRSN